MTRAETLVHDFLTQMDAYYASPDTSFYDSTLERKFYEQKLAHIGFKPYPRDGLVTFGASGTNKCDREIAFKNGRVKAEKSADIPFRGRQRRQGTAIVDYLQLDILHMPKRIPDRAPFTMSVRESGEWDFEDAAQERVVFTHPHPETGEVISFAITAKPDGKLDYAPDGSRIILEYKTKATGLRPMNGKLDYKGAQDDHKRQVVAESLVFGIDEALIVYESTHKPSWFSDEESSSVTKGQKTWKEGVPLSDMRAFYVRITPAMKNALLDDLTRQAALVYSGEIPDVAVEMTDLCGFCAFRGHCAATLSAENLARLQRAETAMAGGAMAGKAAHKSLRNYLAGVPEGGGSDRSEDEETSAA